ncbi:leucine-rich repeat extensin-like protein 3 [Prosopis cineraria]|uniref:leucine-rich repeat extensin-like protein 3 n=1 Tax=Prosopis cineraria TaxID=364024 RepID=UPI00240F31B8|nr:leucine-rich repeat extensin-like protein 3 [Prosopis cineraria]
MPVTPGYWGVIRPPSFTVFDPRPQIPFVLPPPPPSALHSPPLLAPYRRGPHSLPHLAPYHRPPYPFLIFAHPLRPPTIGSPTPSPVSPHPLHPPSPTLTPFCHSSSSVLLLYYSSERLENHNGKCQYVKVDNNLDDEVDIDKDQLEDMIRNVREEAFEQPSGINPSAESPEVLMNAPLPEALPHSCDSLDQEINASIDFVNEGDLGDMQD